MALPLPKKVLDLVGRQTYWQEKADEEPVVATVVGARWSDTEVQTPRGPRAGIQFLMDTGDGVIRASATYPEPEEHLDDETPENGTVR